MRNGGTPVLVDYLEHIVQAVDRIQRYTRGVDFAAKHPDFRWQDAYGMRNLLVHGYFKVELGIVWKTALEDLPRLRGEVQALLLELGTDEERQP